MPVVKNTHDSLTGIPTIYQCNSDGRQNDTVAADLDGTLLVGRSSFPYFALIAFDVGGIFRLLLLLAAAPLAGLLYHFISESAGIRVLVFATFAGVKVSDIESAAATVLPKHYSEDMHPDTWRVFRSCRRKCVVTANPRIMVEPFLKNYLGVDDVLGTEISSYMGVATGFVGGDTAVLVGENKAVALRGTFGNSMPDIGIGDRLTDLPFMKLCKEKYIVPARPGVRPVRKEALPKLVIFHDGRLVGKPTPLAALLIVLWFPIGVLLSLLRVFSCWLSDKSALSYYIMNLLACPITIKGTAAAAGVRGRGVVFVCSHRTALDAAVVSACLRRITTTTISYSSAAKLIGRKFLDEGKSLVMFPEETTCRGPYLLRFSPLFAELSDQIAPVAIAVKTSMFNGTTARGYKWMDPFFFYMNPFPAYEVTFLNKLSPEERCYISSGQKSSHHQVANNVQKMIAQSLKYEVTDFTRRDKYRALVGSDGHV
ncbi:hypothetical protein ACP275_14G026300 [Erythranthe tilingii]